MDVRKWSADQLMQLPKNCFGQRWPISFCANIENAAVAYFISEMALPERTVIWGAWVFGETVTTVGLPVGASFATFKLGDLLPTGATFGGMEDIFRGSDLIYVGERSLFDTGGFVPMRVLLATAGRRICLRLGNLSAGNRYVSAGLIVSSVPREVPDCLLSG